MRGRIVGTLRRCKESIATGSDTSCIRLWSGGFRDGVGIALRRT